MELEHSLKWFRKKVVFVCVCVCVCVCVYTCANEVRQTDHEMGEVYMEVTCIILAFLQFSKFKLHQSKNYQKKECL